MPGVYKWLCVVIFSFLDSICNGKWREGEKCKIKAEETENKNRTEADAWR